MQKAAVIPVGVHHQMLSIVSLINGQFNSFTACFGLYPFELRLASLPEKHDGRAGRGRGDAYPDSVHIRGSVGGKRKICLDKA